MVGILLMNTALALCEDGNYSTSFLHLLATDDCNHDTGSPNNTNNGNTVSLYTSTKAGYYQYDLSTIPNVNVVSSELILWHSSTATNVACNLYELDSNLWDETTLTYNNRPLYGDLIVSKNYALARTVNIFDVTDWVKDRIDNNVTAVSFYGSTDDGDNLPLGSKYHTNTYESHLIVEYGNPIDPLDTTIKSQTYNFANVTDADLYNNFYYNSGVSSDYGFVGSESNTAYTKIGVDDGNYYGIASPEATAGNSQIRFETKIDQNVSDIRRIEIKHKYLHDSSGASSTYPNHFSRVYDYDSLTWVYNNTDIYGCDNEYRESTWFYKTLTTFEIIIVDNFDKYINEDGVLKYASRGYEASSLGLYMDTYYYQVEVFYYEAPVITPPVVDDGDDDPIVSPVYPDLTDDNPIISVDGTYSGDLQNVLFRNLININDNYGIPTWAFILIGGIIGVWKRRPELVIFCGLLFLFLLFFGYKLTMAVV